MHPSRSVPFLGGHRFDSSKAGARPAPGPEREPSSIALKTPWSDGTTAIILSPTELIEKLAALVPYLHKNRMIYSGFLAPDHALRRFIVPLHPRKPPIEDEVAEPDRKGTVEFLTFRL